MAGLWAILQSDWLERQILPGRSCRIFVAEALGQGGFNAGPVGVDNCELDRIAHPPAWHDHMAVKIAFLSGAELGDGPACPFIERISAELNTLSVQDRKGMLKEQQFRCEIGAPTPLLARQPGLADFEAAMLGHNVEKAGAADYGAACAQANRKR